MSIAKLKLGTKLALGFGLILILLAVIVGLAIIRLNFLNASVEELVKSKMPKVSWAHDIKDSVNVIARATRNMVLNPAADAFAQEKDRIEKERKDYLASLANLEKTVTSQKGRELLAKIKEGQAKTKPFTDKVINLAAERKVEEAARIIFTDVREHQAQLLNALQAMADYQLELAKQEGETASRTVVATQAFLYFLGGGAIFLGCLIAFFLTRSVTGPIKRAINGLSEGAEQVAAAATQVSSASQSLAQGSSQQAAAIEETSASLEEMSGMTRQNADNASQADSLMQEAAQVVDGANRSMEELIKSMKEVSAASEETAKIIKTIDEIAFQTNLLALNAAVEAARAGEAGAGFAVVADEVRNLAMRAAEAAKNTANLIEGTVLKVKHGAELVEKTGGDFSRVSASTAKVKGLVAEIAAASNEQAQGVGQVNQAVNEMNSVTQQVAANAEESAASAEELNSQAEQMKGYVAELSAIVGGSAAAATGGDLGTMRLAPPPRVQPAARPSPGRKLLGHKKPASGVDPERIIPLDDGESKHF